MYAVNEEQLRNKHARRNRLDSGPLVHGGIDGANMVACVYVCCKEHAKRMPGLCNFTHCKHSHNSIRTVSVQTLCVLDLNGDKTRDGIQSGCDPTHQKVHHIFFSLTKKAQRRKFSFFCFAYLGHAPALPDTAREDRCLCSGTDEGLPPSVPLPCSCCPEVRCCCCCCCCCSILCCSCMTACRRARI